MKDSNVKGIKEKSVCSNRSKIDQLKFWRSVMWLIFWWLLPPLPITYFSVCTLLSLTPLTKVLKIKQKTVQFLGEGPSLGQMKKKFVSSITFLPDFQRETCFSIFYEFFHYSIRLQGIFVSINNNPFLAWKGLMLFFYSSDKNSRCFRFR